MQYRITFDAGTAEHSFGTLSLTKAYYAGSLYRISREVEFPYSLNGVGISFMYIYDKAVSWHSKNNALSYIIFYVENW